MKVQLKKIARVDSWISDPIFRLISQTAQQLNYKVYVVGGFVRDKLLSRQENLHDVDILCDKEPDKLVYSLAEKLTPKPKIAIYGKFRTASLQYQNWKIEFAGARKESYSPESRKPQVEPASIEEDFLRRDFTINALAISLNQEDYGWLIDPFTGIEDIKRRLIRTPVDPVTTFYDDPLRMLRAIRFATVLLFRIEKDTLEGIKKCRERISIVSAERISEELNKILLAPKPSIGFKLLYETGLLEIILPEVHALAGVEEKEGIRHKDNFKHTLQVLDSVALETRDLWTRWAALLHDIGKPKTKNFEPGVGWTFHGHEIVGASMIKPIFQRLRLPLDERLKKVKTLVKLHQRPVNLVLENITDSAIRRLIHDAGDYLEDLLILCKADITTKNPRKKQKYLQQYEELKKRIKEVEERDRIRNFQPPITGDIIMKVFGIGPSKTVGEIKQAIKDAILEGKINNDFLQAFNLMITIGKQKGLTPKYTLEELLKEEAAKQDKQKAQS